MRFRRSSSALAVAVLLLVSLAPVPAAADGPVHLKLQLGSRCVSGHKTTEDPITVKLLRSNGTVIQTRHDHTTDLGWKVCFSSGHAPVPGNKLRLIHFGTDRTVRVPDLTVGLDRVSSVVKGHAPAGKTIQLDALSCDPNGRCIEQPPVMVTASSQGRYRKDLSPDIDIDGSDVVTAGYTDSHQDLFYARAQAPYMTITKPDKVTLSCLPAGSTTVKIRNAAGALRASRTFHIAHGCGSASWTFQTISLHTGDRITSDFASDAKLVWPHVSVSAHDRSYHGRCFANTYLILTIKVGDETWQFAGQTDADGRFGTDNHYVEIPAGSTVRIACESKPGDRVVATAKAT